MKKWLAGLLASTLLSVAGPALAATSFEPGINWKTLESAHFRVSYPDGLEDLGRKVLAYAEDAHKTVGKYMKVDTYEKTDIVCFDTYDDTNANASNWNHNHINLNLNPPSPDSGFAIGRYDDWIRYVLLHEYTHILHQNETPWALMELNAIVGSLFFTSVQVPGIPSYIARYIPNYLSDSPRFITEGWGVTMESKFTTGGRAVEGDQDMKLRMAALENRLYTLDQVNGSYTLNWPSAGNEYDYGTAFFQYLTATYGEEAPVKILNVLGKTPWLGIDFAIGQVIPGQNASSIWDATTAWLKRRSAQQAQEIKRSPLTLSTALTKSGRSHHHPKWLQDGSILVTESYKNKGAGLIQVKGAGDATRWFGKDPLSDYALSADGRYVYFVRQGDDSARFTSYNDLYRYDRQTHEVKQLTNQMRASDPALSPDGKRLVAIVTSKGSNYLALLDSDGKLLARLSEPTLEATYANPAWAPDGKSFVVSRWSQGRYNLVSVDPANGAQTPLTTGNALDFYPSYSPDGQYLIFTSDRSGVFNLYALRLKDNQLFRVSNVLGGAFEGSISPDGKQIAFANYTSAGYDLHVMPFEPKSLRPVSMDEALASDFDGRFQPRQVKVPTPVDMSLALSATPKPYSPWPTLAPVTYSPLAAFSTSGSFVGMSTSGQDALRQHFYSVYGAYTFGGLPILSNRPLGGFYYQNDQLMPSLSVTFNEYQGGSVYTYPVQGGYLPLTLWQENREVDLQARWPGIPFPLLGSSWTTGDSWIVGTKLTNAENFAVSTQDGKQAFSTRDPKTGAPFDPVTGQNTPLPKQPISRDEGQTNTVYLAYQRADNFRYAYGVSPTGGSLTSVGYEKSSPALGSVSDFDRVWADYRQYLGLPWDHHVVALRGVTGMSWGENGGYYVLGGNSSPNFLNSMDMTSIAFGSTSNLDTSRLGFRGYDVAGVGNKFALLSAEYRFPLLTVQKGLWTLPFYLDQVYGTAGLDVGNVWDVPGAPGAFRADQTLAGASFELRAKVALFRGLGTNVRLGLAQGLATNGSTKPATQLILGFGNTF